MPGTSRILWPLASLLVALGCLLSCRGTPAAVNIEHANAQFAWSLYGEVAGDPGNLFFSPFSVSSALGMTLLGARGETQQQMQQVLFGGGDLHEQLGALTRQLVEAGRPAAQGTGEGGGSAAGEPFAPAGGQPGGRAAATQAYELTVANALWLQDGFTLRAGFLGATADHYGAQPFAVDFRAQPDAARQRVNTWVADETRQKIRDLLAPGSVTPATRLVLANAIYFKSAWQTPFQAAATQPAPFHLANGEVVEAPLMRQTGRFAYREIDGAQVLRLPYKGGELAMLVVLPRTAAGLGEMESSLTAAALLDLVAGAGETVRRVEVHLPRFRVEKLLNLGPPLAALGMPAAFSPEQADFSGMTGGKDLCIDAVVHKAFVEVDEEGTEAAAATAVTMMATSIAMDPEEPVVFKADRPFLFCIVHQPSNSLLFLGRMVDPA